jgi:glycine oxidase
VPLWGDADPNTTIPNFICGDDAYAVNVKSESPSALVVGAGIIGLTSAFRLARSGYSVTLFDPTPARGATWAAAGMLAPSAETSPGEESNYALQRGAVSMWHDLSDELFALTGSRVNIHETGTLLVGWDLSDCRLVSQAARVASNFGAVCHDVSRKESPEFFTLLSARITQGLFMPDDAWVDPDQAVDILLRALEVLNVHVVTERVHRVSGDKLGVQATTSTGIFNASKGILATGALSVPGGVVTSGDNVVRPVHGVTLRVDGVDRSSLPTVRAFVRGRNFYMVSRPGGYCVLGATAEERSDLSVQVGELQRLLRDALDIVPSLESATVVENRFGLRPASEDLQPFFEILPLGGWAWSSGHYRHGVTLAPLAAQWALDFVEGAA